LRGCGSGPELLVREGDLEVQGNSDLAQSRRDAKNCEGQGKSMKGLEKRVFTTEGAEDAEGGAQRWMLDSCLLAVERSRDAGRDECEAK